MPESSAKRNEVGGKGFRIWEEEVTERHGRANYNKDRRSIMEMTVVADPASNGIPRS